MKEGQDDLPAAVRDLLQRAVRSVEQLEILLLLQRRPDEWWNAARVADELRTSAASAARRLEELAGHGFFDVRVGEAMNFRYAPPSAELAEAVALLAATYRERRVRVISFLYSRPADRLTDFVDAFRLRRGDRSDG